MIAAPSHEATARRAAPASDSSREATALAVACRAASPEERPALMAKLWEIARPTGAFWARKVYRPCAGCDLEDLIQESALILSFAVMAYDPGPAEFLTYYRHALRRRLPPTMHVLRSSIRVPEHLCRALSAEARGEVSPSAAHYSEESLLAGRSSRAVTITSFDPEIHAALAVAPETPDAMDDRERAARIRVLIADLPDRSRHILNRHFGLDGLPKQTFVALGRDLGIASSAAWTDCYRAIAALREQVAALAG